MYALLRAGAAPTGNGNAGFVALLVASLAILGLETVADEEPWSFHRAKRFGPVGRCHPERFRTDEERGFLASGHFRHSMHPNSFAELAQWWCLALVAWCVSAASSWLLVGTVVLTALFAGSTVFTEGFSAAKYRHTKSTRSGSARSFPGSARSRTKAGRLKVDLFTAAIGQEAGSGNIVQ
jgi:steroid 5-alpha reductase family enzyme